MDLSTFNEALGLASSAVGLTGKAASTISTIKGMFEGGKAPDNSKASELLNDLAAELTMANMANVQLSQALKTLSAELQAQQDFDKEKARYGLFQTIEGDMVYRLKEAMADGHPTHFVCPVCMNRDRLISFIVGESDFKVCQTNRDHTFRFKKTDWQSGRVRTNFNPHDF
ncbi:hypothetical protein RvVAR0630_30340 [Agrobacterium vitis]|uniref:hypothetical protein n=1 Tax=Agrobacterium vitis TaxID=373 RepID=UPI0015D67B37|nr:hypothetical protein [Agrobacterium vitis]BCH60410.1 hypothetical protein RvVAR0630_30340 [Agrobacterium vitis]